MIHFVYALFIALFIAFVITLKVYAPVVLALLTIAWWGSLIGYEIGRIYGAW